MTQLDTVSFRPACQRDIPALCDLLEALFTLESDFHPDRDKQARALQLLIDKHAANPTRPACVVWVAELAGKVIGMCSLQVLISTAEGGEVGLVEDVIIAAEHRQRGLGPQMLHSLESWAHERGLHRVQLLADTHNHAALAFYERHGWQRMQMLAMRKRLTRD
ncbi:MAG: GNAT family N-acetyltransferase [Gammaproteobacteria bacterium]|nr:GNAT family N-acetyltransferase [Gammaproteobacteria bacterium]